MVNRVSRVAMDAAERAVNNGQVFGEVAGAQRDQLCSSCHGENVARTSTTVTPDWRQPPDPGSCLRGRCGKTCPHRWEAAAGKPAQGTRSDEAERVPLKTLEGSGFPLHFFQLCYYRRAAL